MGTFDCITTEGRARRGRLHTVHGDIETPVFMNVGTSAAIKGGVSTDDLRDRFRTDEVFLRETGTNAGYYVTSNAGATEKIMHMINF